jgi:uncharacterized membrane protein YphA (DoxX/SURF4 family)
MDKVANQRALLVGATIVARVALALIFGLAAVGKITAPGLFRATVENYHMLPQVLVTPFAYALPWVEAIVALYLLVGLFLRWAAVAAAGMLLMFIVALTVQIARGNVAIGCGCLPTGGPLAQLPLVQWVAGGTTIGWFDVGRDIVLLGLALLIVVGGERAWSVDAWLRGDLGDDEGEAAEQGAKLTVARRKSL